MSKAVRAAMVAASVGNVKACLTMDESEDRWLTSAPTADVRNILDELERLRGIETTVKDLIRKLEKLRSNALENARKYRDQWQIGYALDYERAAHRYMTEIDTLEEILDS